MSKVVLDNEATESLKLMLDALKNESNFVKLKSGKLNSWIVNRFYEKHFKSDKALIIKDYFNPKDHLKFALAQAENDEELIKAMELSLKQMKRKPKSISTIDNVQSS